MRAISSHRDITMRVLIVSALIACVSAAPSFLAPIPYAAVALPGIAVGPTIAPGDIQAAAIDAQVKAADQAQFLADQARELAEQAAENQNEGVSEANDLTKERSEEAFWSAEEKKWQAMNEAQIAEAKIAAAVADNAAELAKTYSAGIAGIVPSVATPEVADAGITVEAVSGMEVKSAGAEVKSAGAEVQSAEKSETNTEVKSEEKEALVKSAEEKPIEKSAEGEKKETATPDLKTAVEEALKAQNLAIQAYNAAILPSLGLAHGLPANLAVASAPISYQSVSPSLAAPISYQSVSPFAYQAAYRAFPVHLQPVPANFYSPIVAAKGW